MSKLATVFTKDTIDTDKWMRLDEGEVQHMGTARSLRIKPTRTGGVRIHSYDQENYSDACYMNAAQLDALIDRLIGIRGDIQAKRKSK